MNESISKQTRILIVDDDVDLAHTTALILTRKGFAVSVASDGLAAIRLVGQQPFDFALMDIRMPGLDGVETCQRIKTIQPDLAVVLMTGFSVEERVQAGLREGARAVLVKPLDLEHLFELIKNAVAQRHPLVLVVDDHPDTCATLTLILKQKGYTVGSVENGEQAIALVTEHQYDIIFIDLKLPTIDGAQTFLAIRARDPKVAVVMMTGYREEMTERIETALRAGAIVCLYKPLAVEQVLAVVNAIKSQ
ncbi:MAG: response regulator [Anaerolineales bacterium]|nr:response regulator [Anaerolineales bacterium]